MNKIMRVALGVSLCVSGASAWADLTVINKSQQEVHFKSSLTNPPAGVTVAANGQQSLPAATWAPDAAKQMYFNAYAGDQTKQDFCSQTGFYTKYHNDKVASNGFLVLQGGTPSASSCQYYSTKVTWSPSEDTAKVSSSDGSGQLVFDANAKATSPDAKVTYQFSIVPASGKAAVGKIGKVVLNGASSMVQLSGFKGVADKAESIKMTATADGSMNSVSVNVPVEVVNTPVASQMPYRQLNVGENYVTNQQNQLIAAGTYLGGSGLTLVTQNPLSGDLMIKGGVVSVTHPVTASQFAALTSPSCKAYTVPTSGAAGITDSNIKQCDMQFRNDQGQTMSLPLLINNGLHAVSTPTLVKEHVGPNGNIIGPDYFTVATLPQQSFSLPLQPYISDLAKTNGPIQWAADSARVQGKASLDTNPGLQAYAKQAVAYIPMVGSVQHGSLSDFGLSLDSKSGVLSSSGIAKPGIYQINLAAYIPSSDASVALEKAYVTFYIDVNSTVDFGQWQKGSEPSNSVLKVKGSQPLTMVYTYSHADPTKSIGSFAQLYRSYASDIAYANDQSYMPKAAPINVMALEAGGPEYAAGAAHWLTNPLKTNIKQQITDSNSLQNGLGNPLNWLPQTISAVNGESQQLIISPDLTFGQNLRAAFTMYNFEQNDLVTNLMLQDYAGIDYLKAPSDPSAAAVIDAGTLGINLDLEKGTSAQWAPFFKMLADKLAYQGKFFGYYEFADKAFQPSVVAAMGPLGVAFVSSYDVGTLRASTQQYAKDGMDSENVTSLYDMFHTNQSCDSGSGDPVGRSSWCNLSMSDSKAANLLAWTGITQTAYHLSTQQVMEDFDGHYSVTMPFAESSTDFSVQELINPNFDPNLHSDDPKKVKVHNVVKSGGGLVLTNPQGCQGVTNNWLQTNSPSIIDTLSRYSTEAAREKYSNAHGGAYTHLAQCLFSDVRLRNSHLKPTSAGFTPGYFTDCGDNPTTGQPIPLSKCILIRGIPSTMGAVGASLAYPTPYGYMKENYQPYLIGGKLDPRMVGYSLFALQNVPSEPGNGSEFYDKAQPGNYNLAIQEPWYVGGPAFNPGDAHAVNMTNTKSPYDPFYHTKWQKIYSQLAWKGVGMLQQQFAPATAAQAQVNIAPLWVPGLMEH